MKRGSTAASGSGLHAFQPSMSLEAGSRKVHAHFSSLMHTFWCRALTDTGRPQKGLNSNKKSQCTFWCRVLTDDDPPTSGGGHLASQCTFWCRALTDSPALAKCTAMVACLNAPSGAGCLPTVQAGVQYELTTVSSQCTFWCRVLTDYNMKEVLEWVERLSQCTFWCRVLTDWKWSMSARLLTGLNAPSGAGCLPTQEGVNDGQG